MFVSELRRPVIRGHLYRQILIVAEKVPTRWNYITKKFNDVYLLLGKITQRDTLQKLNAHSAYALTLLASRDDVTKVDEEFISSETLFSYLKLDPFIPSDVFFSVELTSSSNIGGKGLQDALQT